MPSHALKRVRFALVLGLALFARESRGSQPKLAVDFNRDVRTILSDNCFHCHGPDKKHSNLRLDVAGAAIEKGVIVPNDPIASVLIDRITSDDADYHMPPPGSNRRLTPAQIETLRQWIEQGARYRPHWAFAPIPKSQVPPVSDFKLWTLNPIDTFVLRRLQKEDIEPSRQASRERLLRRLTLDLTGLPPTIREIDSFLNDGSISAYERAVDRLLNSAAFGERIAMEWLDVARYADTYGYDNDRENHMWPWRDWVIDAFNDNLSFDQFIRWQVAGDLLPSPTQDQLLATAFNRLHRQNAEGGSIPDEFLIEYAADRTQTFGTAFLGLTVECARCHDHKFDPISQRDYYAVFAMLSNIDEAGLYAEKTGATPTPNIFLYREGKKEQHEELRQAIEQAERNLRATAQRAEEHFEVWLPSGAAEIYTPEPLVYLPLDFESQGATLNLAGDSLVAELAGTPGFIDGRVVNAIQFSGDDAVSLKNTGAFERTDSFTLAAWLRPGDGPHRMVLCHNTKPSWEAAGRGYELIIDRGRVEFRLSHFWPGNAIGARTIAALPRNQWTHATVTYDGSSRAQGIRVYFNAQPVELESIRDNLYGTIQYQGHSPPLEVGGRKGDSGFKNGAVDEFMLFGDCLTPIEISHIFNDGQIDAIESADSMSDDMKQALLSYYLERIDVEYAQRREVLRAARQAENVFVNSLPSIMVMREKPTPPTAYVLDRGAYDQRGQQVSADVLSSILPLAEEYPRNRRGLAEWLVQREHPLTARVAVNRFWRMFIGRGLVQTQEDFGSQGTAPTHPDLLDHLAAEFIESGWNVKALCRLIVTSATYRQDSTPRQPLHRRDPNNTLLARGPRHRLSAEQIRDAALAACGLLQREIGGASVKPYQPAGLWKEAGSLRYQPDTGAALYRRSMYTFWKRTVPPPTMLSFDAVNREVCVARRDFTVTPTQALVLLNDPQFVEAARVLAADVTARYGPDLPGAIKEIFKRLIGRAPRPTERDEIVRTYHRQHALFASSELDVKAYINIGEWPSEDSLNAADVAAMTAVVQLLMSFHEFQVKQ